MISELLAQNYGCLHDVTVRFGRLHALIGPNDSGKSTILRAVRTLGQLATESFSHPNDRWNPFDPGFDDIGGVTRPAVLKATTPEGSYSFEKHEVVSMGGRGGISHVEECVEVDGQSTKERRELTERSVLLSRLDPPDWRYGVARELSGVRYLALSEEGLRQPSGFMPKHQLFVSERGEGLPGLYFTLRNDRERAFERILTEVRTLFPTVKTVRTQPRTTTELELEVELVDGTRVRAPHVSTGLLYYLAFAALPEFFGPISTILIEEPENGLHPARIAQVMRVLRALSENQRAQIVITTHSPLVVNELRPEEVSVVTRASIETGTQVTPITATPNFAKRSGVYALGELWLSYADGDIERALFDPTAR